MTLLIILVFAVATDLNEWRISNRLIVLGLFFGLIFCILREGSIGIVHFILNISIPVILLFLFFQLRALGAGDIKLFSVVGGFLTIRQLFDMMMITFLMAAIMGIGKLLYQKFVVKNIKKEKTLIHFSLAILIGYVVVVWGECL